MSLEDELRAGLVEAVRRLDDLGLNVNASGNLSVRLDDGLLVTPSGVPADDLEPDQLVVLHADGTPARPGQTVPTSEWRLHSEIYRRRPLAGAIVHTHSPEATAASAQRASLPPVHYVVARFGGSDLACAPYATYGTPELASAVADTLGSSRVACLMANHGAIALAADLDAAVSLALDVEWFCAVFRRAASLGDPVILDAAEIERVARAFESYGQVDPSD